MKTRERQFFWRLGRGAFGLQVIMLMLVMLAMGISPAWAKSWDNTKNDNGGGTYRYKAESYNILYDAIDLYANFETVKRFDIGNDQFYFDFAMRVYFFRMHHKKHLLKILHSMVKSMWSPPTM